MPFINVKLADAQEQEVVPEGEYDLRCVKSEDKESKKGNPMTQVTIKVEDPEYPNAQLLNHFLLYPTSDASPDQNASRLRDIARFLKLFGIPGEAEGFNSDDIRGSTARATLTQEKGDDGNTYNRLILPRLDA